MCVIGVIFKLLYITQGIGKELQNIKLVREHQQKYVTPHFHETNILHMI